MQYSPKLKKAMEQIKAIIEENDIAALVVLHEPNYSEFFTKLDPSYSCVKVNGDSMRMTARLQEDFGGDKKAWKTKVTDTVNMMQHLIESPGHIMLPLMDTLDKLEDQIEITQEDNEGFSSHTTQNN